MCDGTPCPCNLVEPGPLTPQQFSSRSTRRLVMAVVLALVGGAVGFAVSFHWPGPALAGEIVGLGLLWWWLCARDRADMARVKAWRQPWV